jgi:SAM-dependent methyltransferase
MWFERFVRRNVVPAGHAQERRRSPAPTQVPARDFDRESVPDGGDLRVFEVDAAKRINDARMRAIESLGLDLEGKRVLDVGSGPGHFSPLYTSRGCEVVAIDGRPDNIAECQRQYPLVRGVVGDVQTFELSTLGRFDLIHCFGLLYHLENPIAALRNMFSVCDGVLLLETIVMDASRPVLAIEDESKTVNQALAGIGCRPSPTFVTLALNRVGFRHVYGLAEPPDHEDFRCEWLDDGAWQRDGHPIRSVFVASSRSLTQSRLVALTT